MTRNHPPIPGVDATDHETMHPGIWLALGDVSGHDFWRNKGTIEHLRFSQAPVVDDDQVRFATQSRLLSAEGAEIRCRNLGTAGRVVRLLRRHRRASRGGLH